MLNGIFKKKGPSFPFIGGRFDSLKRLLSARSNTSFIKYIRSKGVVVGDGTVFTSPKTFTIDLTRPSLISIGNDVRFNVNNSIVAHDASSKVFRSVYHSLLPSNGKITIGNNVWFARNVTVLKGTSIGDNCIIGINSTVMSSIPSNSVAAGTPAKVICTLDEYYSKRLNESLEESFVYARSIKEQLGRMPVPEDFFESFVWFVSGDEVDNYPSIPIKYQLGPAYPHYVKNHKAKYKSFEDFLVAAGVK